MKKTIVYSKKMKVHIGGAETLVQRMFEWCSKNGWERFVIIFPKGGQVRNPLFLKEIREKGISVEVYEDEYEKFDYVPKQIMNKGQNGKKLSFGKEEVTWFHEAPSTFLKGQYLEHAFPMTKYRTMIYMLQRGELQVGDFDLLVKLYDLMFIRKIEKDFIVSVSPYCKNITDEYYRRTTRMKIIPQGREFQDFSVEKVEKRYSNRERFVLLTVSRIFLDLKVYLLPMLKSFEILTKRYDNIYLKIIGSGKTNLDTQRFKAAIKALDQECQEKIEWLPEMPYEELGQHFDSAHLYYGTGTTLLDAMDRSLPAIVSDITHIDEAKTDGLFAKSKKTVGVGENNIPLEDIVSQVYQMDKDEYIACARADYENCRAIYDMDGVMEKMLSYDFDDKKRMKKIEIRMVHWLLKSKRWIETIKSTIRRK